MNYSNRTLFTLLAINLLWYAGVFFYSPGLVEVLPLVKAISGIILLIDFLFAVFYTRYSEESGFLSKMKKAIQEEEDILLLENELNKETQS